MSNLINQLVAALAGLTSDQLRAVNHTVGTLLVFAGAGSGKTRVIVLRAAKLILEGKCKPESMMLCTFTRKAAAEMRKRLAGLIGEDQANKVKIGTIHSICLDIMGRRHLKNVIDDKKRYDTIVKLFPLEHLSKEARDYELGNIARAISEFKSNLLTPSKVDEALDMQEVDDSNLYKKPYKAYCDELNSHGWHDFDDLILKVVTSFKLQRNAAVVKKWQDRFQYVFVDEFQDTNMAQAEFIKLISAKSHLCVVGDDDQAIYGWRGAKVDIIQQFVRQNPKATVVNLVKNFRSFQNVLDAAYSIVKLVGHRAKTGALNATKGNDNTLVTVQRCANCDVEASFVADTIQQQVAAGKSYSDFAVLVRQNYQKIKIEAELSARGIPFADGEKSFFERLEIEDILAKLGMSDHEADLVSTVEEIIAGSGYDMNADIVEVRAIKAFYRIAKVFGGDVCSFRQALAHPGIVEEPVVECDKVTISTVHGAKGLEWPVVFLTGMENGVFPTSYAMKSQEAWRMDEERRLAYVAITRAMDKLYVTYADMRERDKCMRDSNPSMFLSDLYSRVLQVNDPLVEEVQSVLHEDVTVEEHCEHSEPIEVGDTVFHKTKGVGSVVAMLNRRAHAEVHFKSAGKLLVVSTSLSKHIEIQTVTTDESCDIDIEL